MVTVKWIRTHSNRDDLTAHLGAGQYVRACGRVTGEYDFLLSGSS